MKKRKITLALMLAMLACNNNGNVAVASNYFWGTGGLGGTGTWDTATTNWYDGTTNVVWPGGANTATFVATAGTVTLSGTENADGLTFSTSGYTLSGGNLTRSTVGTLGVAISPGLSATIASKIIGTDITLNKLGTGTLILTNNNTYTGGTTLSAGTLGVAQSGALGTGTLSMADATTLNAAASGMSITNALSLSGAGTTNTIDTATNTLTMSGVLSMGGGSLVKAGSGTLSLSGANTYSGTTSLSAGGLAVGSGTALGSSSLSMATGTTLIGAADGVVLTNAISLLGAETISTGYHLTLNGNITGAGSLSKTGGGTLTIGGLNSYGGGTTISAGTVQIGNAATSLGTGALTMAGGTFDLNNFSQSIGTLSGTGSVVLGSGTLTINDTALATYSGTFTGSGSITKAGSFALTLSGASGAGAVNVNGGTLALGASNILSDSGAISIASSGTLNIATFSDTVGSATLNSGTIAGSGTLTAGTYSLNGGAVTANLGTGTLTQSSNTTTLSGTSGATTIIINGGTLALGGSEHLADSGALTVNSGGILNLGGYTETVGAVTLTGGTITNGNLTGTNYAVQNGTISANLGGSGGLTMSGTGTVTLSGINTYTGTTAVNAGTLVLNGGNAIWDAGVVNVGASGTLQLGANETIGTLNSSGTIVPGTYTLTATNYNFGGGVINTNLGSGNLNFTASTTLNGSSGAGNVQVTGGTLQLGGSNRFTNTPAVQLSNTAGVILDLNNTNQTIGSLAGGGTTGGNITLGSGTLTTGALNTDTTYSGTISGTNGDLVKVGTGTQALNGASTYTGGTALNQGTVSVGNSAALGTGQLTMAVGTTLQAGAAGLNLANNVIVAGAENINTNSNNLTLSGLISGVGALNKNGAGTLTLTGINNSYSDGTALNQGTLAIGASGALGAGKLTMEGGTTLQAAASGLTMANTAKLNGAETIDTSGNSITVTGQIDGVGSLNKINAGTLALTGTNLYTGGTIITGGTVSVSSDANLGTSGLNVGNVTLNGGTLQTSSSFATTRNVQVNAVAGNTIDTGANTLTLAKSLDSNGGLFGAGNVSKTNTGTLQINATGTFSGVLTLAQGTLGIGVSTMFGASPTGSIRTTGSVLDYTDGVVNNVAVQIASNTTQFQVLTGTATQSGVISEDAGGRPLEKIGSGTLILSGINTYTGLTTITGGTLQLNGGSAIADLGAVNVSALGTLKLGNASETIGSLAGSAGSEVNLQNYTLTTGGNNGSTTFAGVMSGTGGLSKSGTGTMTLSGANTSTGETTIAEGTLSVQNGAAIANTSDVKITASGATLNLQSSETIGGLDGVSGSLVTLDGNTLTVGVNGTALGNPGDGAGTFAGIMSGTGGLSKDGLGTLLLTGANTYTGDTTIAEGTLSLQNGAAIANTSDVKITASGATLNLLSSETIGGLDGVSGSLVTLGGNTLTVGVNGVALANPGDGAGTFAGIMSGTGGLSKNGLGTLLLTGANTYTGDTTIAESTLSVQNGAAIANTSDVKITASGATLNLQSNETIGGLDGVSGSLVTLDGNTLTVGVNGMALGNPGDGAGTFAGIMSGTGGLSKDGLGTLLLTGANTYTGDTTIAEGTLSLQNGAAIANTSDVKITASGATLNLLSSETIGGLDGVSGSLVTLGGNTLTVGVNGTALGNPGDGAGTFAGIMSGTSGLTKDGPGTMILTGANTYSGATTVNGGILKASGTGTGGHAFGTLSAVTLGNTSGVALDLNSTSQTIGSLAGGGTTGGNVTLGSGTLITGGDNSSTSFGGVISGTGSLQKSGTGVMTLTGANTYSGGTTVSAGTLQGDTTSLQGNIVNNASLLFNQGSNGTYLSTITGTGTTTKTGSGSLTVTGSLTQGNMTLAQGVLVNAGSITLGSGDLAMGNSTTLFNNAGATITAGTITGAGGVQTIEQRGTIVAATVDLGAGDDLMTVRGNAIISGIGTLSGGSGTDALLFDGWTGTPSAGKGYLGAAVTNWESIHLTNNSSVHLGASKSIGAGVMTIDAGSSVYAYGSSPGTYTISGSYVNNGLLSMMDPLTPAADDKVTVTGNWSGIGTLGLDVSLSTGGYDQLVVQGSASGTTTVNLQEVQGRQALIRPTHLDLVHVNGTGQGSFVAGQYSFNYGSGTANYSYDLNYDTSTGTYLLGNFILKNYPETMAVLQGATPFIERMGSEAVTRFADRKAGECGWWSRAYGDSFKLTLSGRAGTMADGKAAGLQVGTDLFTGRGDDGSGWSAGVLVGSAYGQADITGYTTSKAGSMTDRAYSTGLYAEVKPTRQFRVDAVALGTYHDFELNIASDSQRFNMNPWSVTGSLEAGYAIPSGDTFTVEPQAQLVWQHTGEISITRPDVGEANTVSHDGLQSRLGISGSMNNGKGKLNPFVEANVVREFSTGTRVLLVRNNETISSWPETTWIGGAVGVKRDASSEDGLGYFVKLDGMFGMKDANNHSYMLSAGLTKLF